VKLFANVDGFDSLNSRSIQRLLGRIELPPDLIEVRYEAGFLVFRKVAACGLTLEQQAREQVSDSAPTIPLSYGHASFQAEPVAQSIA